MYYTYTAKNLLRRGLWHLGPFSVPLLYFYQICRDLYRNKPINSLALFNSLNLAIYDTFLWIFMHLRTKTETYRAKMVQERGLIQLLKLE